MMEKNGNTLAPGDQVYIAGLGHKIASDAREKGKIVDVDVDSQTALVKVGNNQRWIPLNELERA